MKILYFYPENPFELNQGNNARALALLRYFKSKIYKVDYVGVASEIFSEVDLESMKKANLIENGFLLRRDECISKILGYLFSYAIPNKLKGRIRDFDRTRFGHKKQFSKILKDNQYDYIIISYAYWAELVRKNKYLKEAKLIIDTHDFLTSQFQNRKRFNLGKYFKKEIEILNFFPKVIVISSDENYLFSQFVTSEIITIPHFLEAKFQLNSIEKKYDLVYVASSNEHNVKSAKWFFEEVYPKLNPNLSICVVGKINKHIPELPNVTKMHFVEDLNQIYSESKVAICPMLSGTGLKIKVVEALSFGLPIVCSPKGIDGLTNKTDNGCLVAEDATTFSNYIEQLMIDDNFYQQQQTLSANFFLKNLSVESIYSQLDKVFK
ncbi:glycosyltransferase [Flavobacterium luminosum]|uniref:Glycosyltransferase family 4 protein n=1 Tax=Flavobacterium luminosum TaxID=2949086 RepID=A0ABT0TMP7_9FLAO|nr:glycosyltransferase [Flavobacterium sp. HXWNR70]MCL9808742.1 glycosyltransferase family 4 protein [Flavobacterium sp. HXWNR70]